MAAEHDVVSADFDASENLSDETKAKITDKLIKANPMSKSWLLTINNPDKYGYTQELLVGLLHTLSLVCFCMGQEIGDKGTPHYHIYLYAHSRLRFSTLHNLIPEAHIDRPRGTALQCRDYIRKEGSYRNEAKAHTRVDGTYLEWGEFPSPCEEKGGASYELLVMLQAGKSNTEIWGQSADLIFNTKQLDAARLALLADKAETAFRDVTVTYLCGPPHIDLTGIVYARHAASDICRIAKYQTGGSAVHFDAYHGQSVLLLDNFYSDIPLRDLLQMAGRYPYQLPARFNDRPAAYLSIYIVSNWLPEEQYALDGPHAQQAFLNRIDCRIEVLPDGTLEERDMRAQIILDSTDSKESTGEALSAPPDSTNTKQKEVKND